MNKRYFGIIDGAGQAFVVPGYIHEHEPDRDPRFILPCEVVDRANVVYDIDNEVLVKSRWADRESPEALRIFRGIFSALMMSTAELKTKYDGTNYGSRTHRSI